MTEFLFFDSGDAILFSRSDAESATWTVEEMSVDVTFPYDPEKNILRGMRIGFTDTEGVTQVFEIRKVKTEEPDHCQQIMAEHIVISELSDEMFSGDNWTNKTAAYALGDILTGTLWSVGTSTASGTSSGKTDTGDVWESLRVIEDNWNVYLVPRVTVGASGITGRYIDIKPYGGTWNGLRLSLDKNTDEIGVTWDDTKVKTALYGYGAMTGTGDNKKPLTFASATWSATADHPAKPLNQEYLEDPSARDTYGRGSGTPKRNRFGYYQNGDINDANVLLQKTWEVLKTVNVPEVSIECNVIDLYRLGYTDVPLRLHDTAIIEIRPTGVNLQKEIIRLTVDLLDPSATRVTIGAYIPNIVYINEDANRSANGGGGGSGTRAQGAQTKKQYETFLQMNDYLIDLRAVEYVSEGSAEILRQAGLSLNAQGVLIYADDNANMLQSKLNVQAGKISLVVDNNNNVKAGVIVDAINDSGSSVVIMASHIDIDGIETSISGWLGANDVTIGWLEIVNSLSVTGASEFSTVNCGSLSADGGIDCATLEVDGSAATWQSTSVVTGVTVSAAHDYVYHDQYGQEQLANGKLVTAVSSSTLHYLGSAPT